MIHQHSNSRPSPSSYRINDCLQQAILEGLDRLDAQLLMLWALGKPLDQRAWLMAHDQDFLDTEAYDKWLAFKQRRLAGEPFAYIVEQQDFYGLRLKVNSDVLIPRPDTETLVDWALEIAQQQSAGFSSGNHRFLDLGTGSGAIVLAFKNQQILWDCWAIDASIEALEVARLNGQSLQLPVHWLQSHWFNQVPDTLKFSLIVANPPYIVPNDPHLAQLQHEPLQALVAADHGLSDLTCIIEQARSYLLPGGFLLLEHGFDQALAVQQRLLEHGFSQIKSRQDLGGHWRCTGACWQP